MNISAKNLDFKELNEKIKASDGDVLIADCCGQRFIGSGLKGRKLTIEGVPGNALGAYLDGGSIEVHGSVQEAVGDTMNNGEIIVRGNAGDALGYAMRGGEIFIRGNAGYRAGIHMKEYKDKKPVIVIGGNAGSFLGEYLAGGLIIVLGIGAEKVPVGNFTGTGMHGGRIFIRTDKELTGLPEQVVKKIASNDELKEIEPYITRFAEYFDADEKPTMKERYYMLEPNAKSPYKQLYTTN